MILILILIIIITLYCVNVNRKYKNSEYFKENKISLFKLIKDTGKYGEYLTYKKLASLKGNNKFLFNVYIPKDDGTTTEIDIIMINEKGIFLFESKNYSGRIFGNENDRIWTQTLSNEKGKISKYTFLNPIIQNNIHLKWLKNFLSEYEDIPYYSYMYLVKDVN